MGKRDKDEDVDDRGAGLWADTLGGAGAGVGMARRIACVLGRFRGGDARPLSSWSSGVWMGFGGRGGRLLGRGAESISLGASCFAFG